MPDEQSDKKRTVAYVPFKTFLNAIESLEHGLPNVVDRTVWPSYSGVMQSQVLGAFRFLGLINAVGVPTPELQKLIEDKASRKAQLRKLLERSYASLVKRDLTKMSAGSFDTAMREYGVTGDTHRKASSFFLQAARYAELPLSPYILKQTRNVSGTRKRRVVAPVLQPREQYVGDISGVADKGPDSGGPTKSIMLENSITLSLRTSADTFKMTGSDRQFVLGLLEQMEKYEAEHASDEGKEANDQEG